MGSEPRREAKMYAKKRTEGSEDRLGDTEIGSYKNAEDLPRCVTRMEETQEIDGMRILD